MTYVLCSEVYVLASAGGSNIAHLQVKLQVVKYQHLKKL